MEWRTDVLREVYAHLQQVLPFGAVASCIGHTLRVHLPTGDVVTAEFRSIREIQGLHSTRITLR